MVIYFMRHTAVDVPQGVCYGQTDVPLKPTFEMEATQTAAHLQGLSFDKVYTSPLTRCVRLATFCGYPDAERDDRLKELNFGDCGMVCRWFMDGTVCCDCRFACSLLCMCSYRGLDIDCQLCHFQNMAHCQ